MEAVNNFDDNITKTNFNELFPGKQLDKQNFLIREINLIELAFEIHFNL